MPPNSVKTIEDKILYEFAVLISKGASADKGVMDIYNALKSGVISMSSVMREWRLECQLPPACVFCKSKDDLTTGYLVPKKRGGSDKPDNLVLSCKSCESSRKDKGVFQWLGPQKRESLHRLVAGKYLKQLHDLHKALGTLSISALSLETLCKHCKSSEACKEHAVQGELTWFCLESVF
jgi:5-methylcytosine-specific restriction endonuclease McrA